MSRAMCLSSRGYNVKVKGHSLVEGGRETGKDQDERK